MSGRTVLAVRLDNAGDVLLTGPALRALGSRGDRVVLLAGPHGAAAGELLPGVDELLVWDAPWVGFDPPPVDSGDVARLVSRVRAVGADEAVVFTSFHQSPLPTALLLRLAGVPRIAAISVDYPGSLLDLRHRVDDDVHEVDRALSLAAAAGHRLPSGDDGEPRVRPDLPDVRALAGSTPYVVVHPGASVPARAPSPGWSRGLVEALLARGHRVLVTGAPGERDLTAHVAAPGALDLGGRTSLAQLAAVLRGALVAVTGNTGPGHLAAAAGTPVVSLFAPVVPAGRWAPRGAPVRLLGDQQAPCRDTRARVCPVPGHPCLESVRAAEVVEAVELLAGTREAVA